MDFALDLMGNCARTDDGYGAAMDNYGRFDFSKLFSDLGYVGFSPEVCTSSKTSDGQTITMEIPGCSRDDTKVSVKNGILTLTATRPGSSSKVYTRDFILSNEADVNGIAASVKNGILTVSVPEAKRSRNPTVEVKIT